MSATPARSTAPFSRSATTRAAPTMRIARSGCISFAMVYDSPSLTNLQRSIPMAVVTPSEAPTFDTGEATITGLASPSRGSTDTAAWRIRFAPDHPSPAHSISREEIFVVVAGALTAQFHDRDETAEAGGALIVPAGEAFTL